jgi:hypothetical protein
MGHNGFDSTRLQFVWLNETFHPDLDSNYLGINVNTTIEDLGFNKYQEDPRLFVLSNGTLLVSAIEMPINVILLLIANLCR